MIRVGDLWADAADDEAEAEAEAYRDLKSLRICQFLAIPGVDFLTAERLAERLSNPESGVTVRVTAM